MDSSVPIAAERGRLDFAALVQAEDQPEIATRDQRSFPRIPGLPYVVW